MDATRKHLLSRRQMLQGSLACAAFVPILGRGCAPAHAREALTFLAIGDWGQVNKRADAVRVADQMGAVAEALGARFVISTGDNFYPTGVTSTADPLWRTAYEEIYTAASLRCPWYPVLGNHDHRGNVDAQIQYGAISNRWRMSSRFYALSQPLIGGGSVDFLFIDTDPITNWRPKRSWFGPPDAVKTQIEWLKARLSSSRAACKIVIGHHPIFSGGGHGGSQLLVDHVKPLLERFGVSAYINGHDHDLQHIVVDGVHYLTSGAGCDTRRTSAIAGTRFAQSHLGFLTMSLTATGMIATFVGDNGEQLYSAEIPFQARSFAE